jgi:hypothetical protein
MIYIFFFSIQKLFIIGPSSTEIKEQLFALYSLKQFCLSISFSFFTLLYILKKSIIIKKIKKKNKIKRTFLIALTESFGLLLSKFL